MISAVVLTRNEEKNIGECLDRLSWCDEVIVVDDNSTDNTAQIARKKGAKVISHSLNNDFSATRNFGLAQATGEWILFIDADERVSSALWYEIMQYTNNPSNEYTGFFLKRTDHMWGKKLDYGETGSIKLLRLAKKDSGVWVGKVHENWDIKGKKAVLLNPLSHYPHPMIKDFLREINYYTDIRAKELYEKKVKVSGLSIILFPKAKFILNYFLKRGFQDKLPGLVFAIMMSFHSFLTRGKLWVLWQKDKKPHEIS